MNFYDLKTAVEGYVNYLQLMVGLTAEMHRKKNWKLFEYKVRHAYTGRWETIIEFDYSDLNDYLMVRVYQWNDYRLSPKLELHPNRKKFVIKEFGAGRKSLEIKVKSAENMITLMGIFEDIGYFEEWKR
jgi:hypothetical protein